MTTILKSTATGNRTCQTSRLRIGTDEVEDEVLNAVANTREHFRITLVTVVKITLGSSDRLSSLLICLSLVGLISGIRGGLVQQGLVDGLVGRNGAVHLGISGLGKLGNTGTR
jgi:hypothetical protein